MGEPGGGVGVGGGATTAGCCEAAGCGGAARVAVAAPPCPRAPAPRIPAERLLRGGSARGCGAPARARLKHLRSERGAPARPPARPPARARARAHLQWVLELDSSTDDKFSRHLIVRAPGRAFADNVAAGSFVGSLLGRPAALEALYVLRPAPANGGGGGGGGEARVCVVDKGVYTRNRHFRLPWCCTGGKDALREPTARLGLSPVALCAGAWGVGFRGRCGRGFGGPRGVHGV